jgi:predicted  nucleic acid-binding Zn-ribbon protein
MDNIEFIKDEEIYLELCDENKKLKEENKKLQKYKWGQKTINDLINERDKLQEDNKQLFADLDSLETEIKRLRTMIKN